MQTNQVPYATILDGFLIANHCTILLVGVVVLYFSYLASNSDDPNITKAWLYGGVRESDEYYVGGALFLLWIFGNAYFGISTWKTVR